MKNRIATSITLFGLFVIQQPVLAAHPACSADHCSKINATAIEQCHGNAELLGKSPEEYAKMGGKAVTSEQGVVCTCGCSCVVSDTNINTPSGYVSIASIHKDQNVMTPLSKEYVSGTVDKVLVSNSEPQNLQRTAFSNGAVILSSLNHTFITPEEMIISADQLNKQDTVLDAKGNKITVQNISYHAGVVDRLYNLNVNSFSNQPVDHVIDTEGVLSGDWLLQSTHDLVEEEVFLRTSVVQLFDK